MITVGGRIGSRQRARGRSGRTGKEEDEEAFDGDGAWRRRWSPPDPDRGRGGIFRGGVGAVGGEWGGGGGVDKGEEWGADLGRPGWPDGQLGRGPAGGASPPFVFLFLFCIFFSFIYFLFCFILSSLLLQFYKNTST